MALDEKEQNMMKRNQCLDLAKGIGIVLVVLGHCIQYGNGTQFENSCSFFKEPIYAIIYSFHMPLFVLISGFFFAATVRKYDAVTCLKKKMTELLLPILSWGLIYEVATTCLNLYRGKCGLLENSFILNWISYCIDSQWFLWAIFYFSLIFMIGHYFLSDSRLFYVLLFAFFMLLNISDNRYNINSYATNYPLFCIGYCFAEWRHGCVVSDDFMESAKNISVIGIVASLVYCISLWMTSTVYANNYLIRRVLYLFTGTSGSLLFLMLIQITHEHWSRTVVNFFSWMGRKTMGIYIVSGYIVQDILRYLARGWVYRWWNAWIETLVVLFCSGLIVNAISKNRILNKFLMGAKENMSMDV